MGGFFALFRRGINKQGSPLTINAVQACTGNDDSLLVWIPL